ncbi:hypothetical protein Zmor_024015 [Zophobas morio]|uniref:Uncharacterized protein n=1 Tax=Zophobas morio TaxID=2755281 RepID=A0AA38I050_9CUCU|nr:hypothetical protein Zmor_024015 [Zophobas morio]
MYCLIPLQRLYPAFSVPDSRFLLVLPKVVFAEPDGWIVHLQCLSDVALCLCAQETVQMQTFHCVSTEPLLLLPVDDGLDDQALEQEFLSCFLFLHHCYQKVLRDWFTDGKNLPTLNVDGFGKNISDAYRHVICGID